MTKNYQLSDIDPSGNQLAECIAPIDFIQSKFHFAVILALTMTHFAGFSQFVNVTEEQGLFFSGIIQRDTGISTYDFNHDGLDDITLGSVGDGVLVYVNTGSGFTQTSLFEYIPGVISAVQWVDYDNDNDEDFFALRDGDAPVLLRQELDGSFTNESSVLVCPVNNPRSLAAAWADYDNDGFLDLYIANFYLSGAVSNWLFHNNGDGSFTENAESLGIDNGVKPSWQPTWIDIDLDGDVDLFVINERNFGCSLYRNDGDGVFIDIADESGINISEDPMGVAWADFDHDGDFDAYITNSMDGSQFMINDGGVFSDVSDTLDMQLLGYYCWGACFTDVQNDAYEDLFVSTAYTLEESHDYLFMQDTTHSFFAMSDASFPTGDTRSYACAELDFDDNGLTDLLVNTVLPIDIYLLQNTTVADDNHWLKVTLEGTVSNSNAIGTLVRIYTDDICQM
jgi:hypothetical protein